MGLAPAGEADLADLVSLEALGSPHPWTSAQLLGEIHGVGGRVLLLRAAGERLPLGYCAFRVVADEMHIHNLVVHPARRRRGYGHRLLREAIDEAVRCGARRAYLEVRRGNQAARALYAAFGFRESGLRRDYYREPEEDALVLAGELVGEP